MEKGTEILDHLPYKIRKNLDEKEIYDYFEKQRKINRITFIIALPLAILVLLLLFFLDVKVVTPIFIISQIILIFFLFFNSYRQIKFSKEDINAAINNYKNHKGIK